MVAKCNEADDILTAHVAQCSPQEAYVFYCTILDCGAADPKPSTMIERMICDGKDLSTVINRSIEALEGSGLPPVVAERFVVGINWRVKQVEAEAIAKAA